MPILIWSIEGGKNVRSEITWFVASLWQGMGMGNLHTSQNFVIGDLPSGTQEMPPIGCFLEPWLKILKPLLILM